MSYAPHYNAPRGLWYFSHVHKELGSPVGYCGKGDTLHCGGHVNKIEAEECFALYLAKEQTTYNVLVPGPKQLCGDLELHPFYKVDWPLSKLLPRVLGVRHAAVVLGRETIPLCKRHMKDYCVMAILLKRGLNEVMEGR